MRLVPALLFVFATTLASAVSSPARATERGEAIFAAGCFWCVESNFEHVAGVTAVISGFTGGQTKDPTYEMVSNGGTGHAESVRVLFDPTKVTYAHLLDVYWHNVDPLSAGGQFCDRGNQYRSAIYYLDEAQHRAADASKAAVEKRLGKKAVTEIVPASQFYAAEEYHQDFYKKNPEHYQSYRLGCGRDARLKELWGADANSH